VQQLGSADGVQVDCQSIWSELHDVFQKLNAENSALDQCILGGRSMHQGDFHVALVRPDVVRALAGQLAAIAEAEFRSSWPADEHEDAWRLCENIKDLYAKAAEQGDAVVFVASK
jgi:hypothetical protein